ncbi:MAG: hypothetical protein VKK32_04060 [Candidatus Melainabacteria bacterium]|nr:hypothetical protein [Candidatus Melainabacteria bacterium]
MFFFAHKISQFNSKRKLLLSSLVISQFFFMIGFFSYQNPLSALDSRYIISSLKAKETGFTSFDKSFDLTLTFKLRSVSGFARSRLDVKIGDLAFTDTPSSGIGEDFDIQISEADSNLADVTIKLKDIQIASNALAKGTVNYYLTEARTNALVSQDFTFKLSSTDSNSGGSANGGKTPEEIATEKFNTKLADKKQLVVIKVEDSSELASEQVSTIPKTFLINIYHDSDLIPGVEKDLFDPTKTPLVKALKVFRLKDSVRTEITDELSFTPTVDTAASTASGKNLTILKTSELTIKDIQQLQFKIDMTNFLNSNISSAVIPEKAIKDDRWDLDIGGIPLEATDIQSSISSLIFLPVLDSDPSRFNLIAKDTIPLTVRLSTDLNLINNIRKIDFTQAGFRYKTLKANDIFLFDAKPSVNQASINSGNLNFTVDMTLDSERNALISKREIYQKNVAKTLELPFNVIIKDSNGLDVDINGTLKKTIKLSLLDSPRFIKVKEAKAKFRNRVKNNEIFQSLLLSFKYSNTLPRSVDPLVLEMRFLDNSGAELSAGKVFRLADISRILDKKASSDTIVSDNALFRSVITAKTLSENGKPLGEKFSALADAAAKVQIKLKRSQSYLDNLGIIFDDEINASLADTEQNVLTLVLK